MNETIVEINKLFKEFSKELHSPYECAELFCEIRKKYGFEFEIKKIQKFGIKRAFIIKIK